MNYKFIFIILSILSITIFYLSYNKKKDNIKILKISTNTKKLLILLHKIYNNLIINTQYLLNITNNDINFKEILQMKYIEYKFVKWIISLILLDKYPSSSNLQPFQIFKILQQQYHHIIKKNNNYNQKIDIDIFYLWNTKFKNKQKINLSQYLDIENYQILQIIQENINNINNIAYNWIFNDEFFIYPLQYHIYFSTKFDLILYHS